MTSYLIGIAVFVGFLIFIYTKVEKEHKNTSDIEEARELLENIYNK